MAIINQGAAIRLSDGEVKAICEAFSEAFLAGDKLWLFGSRVDKTKKGGDIDLYIETSIQDYEVAITRKFALLGLIKSKIGDQKVDVVLKLKVLSCILPIYEIAITEGIQLV